MVVNYAKDEMTLMPWLRVTYWLLSHTYLEETRRIKRTFVFLVQADDHSRFPVFPLILPASFLKII